MTDPGLERAELIVRPRLEDLLEAWRFIVEAERQQVESLPNRPKPEDFYAPVAQSFRPISTEAPDPVLDEVLKLTNHGDTWLDLGAGWPPGTVTCTVMSSMLPQLPDFGKGRKVIAAILTAAALALTTTTGAATGAYTGPQPRTRPHTPPQSTFPQAPTQLSVRAQLPP